MYTIEEHDAVMCHWSSHE